MNVPHRRFYSDGRGIWYIDKLWPLAAGLPEFDLPVEQVRELDEVTWFSDTWAKRPTCRAVIEHCQRILDPDHLLNFSPAVRSSRSTFPSCTT